MLACLYRNSFGRLFPFSLSISCVIFLFCCFHPSSNFLTSVFPDTAFLAFVCFVLFPLLCLRCLCFLFCLPGPSCVTFYRHYYGFFPLFVVHLCFFFNLMLLCFLTHGVQMQMPNEMISVYAASVPVILFTAGHY